MPVVSDVPVEPVSTVARHAVYALDDVGEAAMALAVDVFWEIDFPTQAIVKS